MDRFTLPLLPMLLLVASSCDGSPQQEQIGNGQYGYTGQQQAVPTQQGATGTMQNTATGGEKVVMHPVTDPNTGMVSQQVPLPASWKMTQATQANEPAITGPGGVKVFYWAGETFTYSNDPFLQQTYQMAGVPMRYPVDIGTYVQQDVAQAMGNKGMRLVKQYPLPQIAASSQAYASKLYRSEPSRDQYLAMGTEWTDAQGEPTFMIVNMMVSEGQNSVFWATNMQVVSAEKDAIASAKAALIYSILNTQYNPQQIAAFNASQQQKNSQSQAQFNARMQDNKRNFDQRQATTRSTNEAVNKNMMDSYNYRMHVNEEIQRGESNYLNDENTVRDNNTGERYQVQTGAEQYWMNNNQEYIPSNDQFYDPNLDQNVNDQQWQEVEIEP